MDITYFTHQWILDKQRVEQIIPILKALVKASQQLVVPLAIERDVTLEGFQVLNFTIQVSSKELLDDFIDNTMPSTDFRIWEQIPIAEASIKTFPDISNYNTDSINEEMLPIFVEGLWNSAHSNEQLLLKLRFHSPLYFRCDWILFEVDSKAWVRSLLESLWRGGSLGSELRFSGEIQISGNLHSIRIVVRLYSAEEVAVFAREVSTRLGSGEWINTSQKYFSQCIPIGRNTSESSNNETLLVELITRVAEFNQVRSS